ncbi:DUF4349 domain-containing protein [Streptomyces sp. NPDC051976]|uniref:DUF4349 domain-containing protein n=1 Tax=Streptomyces sp. NPDC051976 TaxID=3154947 RepID=UPI00343DE758
MTHLTQPTPRAARPDPSPHARPGRRTRVRRRPAAAAGALLLAALVALAGCGGSGDSSADKASAPQARAQGSGQGDGAARNQVAGGSGGPASPGDKAAAAKTPSLAPTYLVRTATLTVRTPHVAAALTSARDLATGLGGYAGDESTSVDSGGHERSTIQLRVPPASYDKLLNDLAALGTLLDRKVTVEDVTSQVVDVQSRIKSQQASVARVRALMDRAGSLSDVASLESELTTRESALEALEAQQASLKEQSGLATVTLQLIEPPVKAAPPKPKPKPKHDGFWTVVGHALRDGWHAFTLTVRAVLVAVSATLPFLVAAAALVVGYRLTPYHRRRTPPPSIRPPAPRTPPRVPAFPGAPEQRAGDGPADEDGPQPVSEGEPRG